MWETEEGSKRGRLIQNSIRAFLKRSWLSPFASLQTASAQAPCTQLASTASALGLGLKITGGQRAHLPHTHRGGGRMHFREMGDLHCLPLTRLRVRGHPTSLVGTRDLNFPQELKSGTPEVCSSLIPCQLETASGPSLGTLGTSRQAPILSSQPIGRARSLSKPKASWEQHGSCLKQNATTSEGEIGTHLRGQ